ncbi:RNA-directed DNA polymerase from mobile element jockey, partial [Stegodyphus mimosarum]
MHLQSTVEFIHESFHSKVLLISPKHLIGLRYYQQAHATWMLSAQLIHVINSYLTNYSFSVHVNSIISASCPSLSGMLQGSCLGLTLFNIFVKDIPKSTSVSLSLYADDMTILSQHKHLDRLVHHIQNYLSNLEHWLITWKIKINVGKYAALIFTHALLP